MKRGLCAVVALAGVACATPVLPPPDPPRSPTIALTPCRLPRSTDDALCGTHPVFENRAVRAGRIITLNLVVLRATGPKPAPDPVFVLVGGPGLGAASSVTGSTVKAWAKVGRERDIVFVDQRGTGKSHALPCRFSDGAALQNQFNDVLPLDRVRACRSALERIADLTLYTTPIAMDDLDEVRAALGYDRINLYGISYGSQTALQYLRQHPTRVRTLALAGVATPATKQPLNFARAAQRALDALIEDCAADPACRAAFPDVTADFAAVLAAFDKGPVTFALPNATAMEPIIMPRVVFVERLRLMLYDLRNASRVPLVIHRAARGDWAPFVTASLASPGGVVVGVSGTYLSITCAETVARITEDDIVRESRETFVGEERTRRHVRACQEWPRAEVPASYYEPVISDVPVLMLSGELDAATPPELGSMAARSLPNGRQILMRNVAHGYWYDCMMGVVAEFYATGSARDLDVTCTRDLRRPPFVTDWPPR